MLDDVYDGCDKCRDEADGSGCLTIKKPIMAWEQGGHEKIY